MMKKEYAKPLTEVIPARMEQRLLSNSGPQSPDADAKKTVFVTEEPDDPWAVRDYNPWED